MLLCRIHSPHYLLKPQGSNNGDAEIIPEHEDVIPCLLKPKELSSMHLNRGLSTQRGVCFRSRRKWFKRVGMEHVTNDISCISLEDSVKVVIKERNSEKGVYTRLIHLRGASEPGMATCALRTHLLKAIL